MEPWVSVLLVLAVWIVVCVIQSWANEPAEGFTDAWDQIREEREHDR